MMRLLPASLRSVMTQTTRRSPRPAAPKRPSSGASARRFSPLSRAAAKVTETAAAAGDIVGGAAKALASPTGVVGAAVEAVWLTTHVAFYPWGLMSRREADSQLGYRVEHLPPVQRGLLISDVEAAGTPILLVHGMVDNRSIFTLLRLGLRRRGFGRVTTMNYSPLTADVRVGAARLAEEVEALVAETGYERIHVVGHSMGGLIARYYVTRLGGDERVHTLVTLGTPHQGTYTAYLWNSQLTKQLRPGSGLMRELDQPVPDCKTRFVAYWSDLDQLVFPQRFAALEHPDLSARNVDLHAVGHMSLPIIGSVVHGISATLAHLDSEGHTLAAGVTELPRRARSAAEHR